MQLSATKLIPVWKPSRVIVTGATGWLASEFAMRFRECVHGVPLVGVSRSNAENGLWDSEYRNSEYDEAFHHEAGDVVVHCAFCRKSVGAGLVESLEWSRAVFGKAMREGAAGIVNMSSQSVYGGGAAGNFENLQLSPTYLYAMAKASSEVLIAAMADSYRYAGSYTSLRLASLMGVSQGQCPNNVLRKFAERALEGKTLKIVGGKQKFSFLSIHDAASAVVRVVTSDPQHWSSAYNIGPKEQTLITDMAVTVANCASRMNALPPVDIVVEESDIELDAGMRSDLAAEELGWLPDQSFPDIVQETVEYIANWMVKNESR